MSEFQNLDPELPKGGQSNDHQIDNTDQHYDDDKVANYHDQPDNHPPGQCDDQQDDKAIDHDQYQTNNNHDINQHYNNNYQPDQCTDQHLVNDQPHDPYYDDNQLVDQQHNHPNDQRPVNSINGNDQYDQQNVP